MSQGMKLQRAMEQGHQPPLSDGELAHQLNVSVQRWQRPADAIG